ncbi:dipeptidase [Legionella sp. CNM-1927-20]|uniref:dipeptidase n=1 Tax=Legionella sp. CNM-1927-20 TaxID=3422221 RepID=UPI00403AE7D2
MALVQKKIREIKNEGIIVDMALGFEPEIEVPDKWELFDRYIQSGFTYIGLAIAGEFTSLETTIRYMARHKANIQSKIDKYVFVEKVDDIYKAKRQNKLALGFWLQGSNPLANDINMIETYYRLGVRSILLCYNSQNAIGSGLVEKVDNGLSRLGFKAVEEMNRVGMLIDLSHAGIKTSLDIIEASRDPVIFSHSNSYHVASHIRNLTDEQIIAVAKKGGIIGINGASQLLGGDKSTSKKMVDHIDYIAKLVGTDHIALGLDLIYFHEILALFYEKAGEVFYPKGYLQENITDSFQPEKIDELIETLLKRGFSELAIKNILGGNYLRVVNQVWK